MDSLPSNTIGIFEIYRRFRDIRSGSVFVHEEEGYRKDGNFQKAKSSREALKQLLKLAELRDSRGLVFWDELYMLMSQIDLMDYSEFSRFYEFVFFMCRENGQKNITVSRAVNGWKLVLAGRFQLLNQWCDFVEDGLLINVEHLELLRHFHNPPLVEKENKNQRHNISEDTWQQILAFSISVRQDLAGYDPEGAWPVLIDEFVEHINRISEPYDNCWSCNCGDSESLSRALENSLPNRENLASVKRKYPEDLQIDNMEALLGHTIYPTDITDLLYCKRSRTTTDENMDIARKSGPLCSSKSACAVEGCLSKGFADLLTTSSGLQISRESRVSST